ncbi:MAG: META domain-containing protein, partial [Candidatus Moranbacteria bacterium]|nr:META domain-containing protein [Candidatus Moranbacteria bacterium]
MNQRRVTNIILIVVIVAIIVAGGYFVFTKQSSVTQTQQSEPPLSQDNLDNVSTSFIGSWEVISVQEDGIQIVPEGNGAVIEFFRDGTYKASGGCNEMMTMSYEIQLEPKLSISAGGTKKKCTKSVVEF